MIRKAAMPPAKLQAIQKAALEQCDAIDGVKDGLIEDPRACHFDPPCSPAKAPTAGMPDRAASRGRHENLRRTEKSAHRSADFTRLPARRGRRSRDVVGLDCPPRRRAPAIRFRQYLLRASGFRRSQVGFPHFQLRRRRRLRRRKGRSGSQRVQSRPAFLPRPRRQTDPVSRLGRCGDPGTSSIQYYDRCIFLTKYPDRRSDKTSRWTISIVCSWFPAWAIAAAGRARTVSATRPRAGADMDPDHDIVSALDRWVEKGVAPEKIIATGKSVDRIRRRH